MRFGSHVHVLIHWIPDGVVARTIDGTEATGATPRAALRRLEQKSDMYHQVNDTAWTS